MRGRKREYDYNSKRRGLRHERNRERWTVLLMLAIGLGMAFALVYFSLIK